jgi:plasmid stabilization system protein ParE
LRNSNKREYVKIIVTPYHVAYHASGDSVEILKVWHGKRMLRPEEFQA